MKPIFRVEGLGKLYHIGASPSHNVTLREKVSETLRAGVGRLRRAGRSEDDETTLWAVRDVSFEVQPGEVVGIIGRNGAGKSTLLKLLSRITEPTEGRAEIYGRIGSLLEVGTGFHPELTGRENIFLNGAILGMHRSEIESKFDEIVAFSEVERFLDTPVKRYSSGMYMRLAFAVAAHLEPEILLVDEVLAVGDTAFQKKCLGKMKDVAKQGWTVLFVSHNLQSIAVLCNRALLISSGRLVEDDDAAKVVERYLSSNSERGQTAAWESHKDAPGTQRMRLRSARVLNAEWQDAGTFGMDDPIYIEITYWVLKDGLETHPGYHLHNGKGILVFVSHDYHDPEWTDVPKAAGVYRSVCEIPGQFLNEGTYIVDVAIVTGFHPEPDIHEKEILSFEVIDSGQSEVRGRFTAEWTIGVLRPKLEWKTTRAVEGERWD